MKKVLFILMCAMMCVTINAQRKTTQVKKQVKTYKFQDIQGIWVGDKALNNEGEWIDLETAISFAFTEYKTGNGKHYAIGAVIGNTLRLPYTFNGINRITIYNPDEQDQKFMHLQILQLKPKESMTANVSLEGDTKPTKIKFMYIDPETE